MNEPVLFSLHYLPCIAYFKELMKHDTIYIETQENYTKQTYRNRCNILSANGKMSLIIPIEHTHSKQMIREVKTQTDANWQRHHWQSIVSAYNNSPYFLYYRDKFEAIFFDKNNTTLFDFNMRLLKLCLTLLKCEKNIELTTVYQKSVENDFRNAFFAKKENIVNADYKSYYQVFDDKFPFTANLSIIDLICNKGPESMDYLL